MVEPAGVNQGRVFCRKCGRPRVMTITRIIKRGYDKIFTCKSCAMTGNDHKSPTRGEQEKENG